MSSTTQTPLPSTKLTTLYPTPGRKRPSMLQLTPVYPSTRCFFQNPAVVSPLPPSKFFEESDDVGMFGPAHSPSQLHVKYQDDDEDDYESYYQQEYILLHEKCSTWSLLVSPWSTFLWLWFKTCKTCYMTISLVFLQQLLLHLPPAATTCTFTTGFCST